MTMSIVYSRKTTGDMDALCSRLEETVKAHRYGILGMIDLQAKMKEKGLDFANRCRIYEVCNPRAAKQVLERDMTISTALPCRISVYQEGDQITVATLRPTQILGLFGVADLAAVAESVEKDILAMVDEAAA
jgi:uncharacterized protein (DUF302 family)